MQLFNYLKGLFHRITKGQIRASCDAVIESLQKHTLPAYAQAVELFRLHKFSSQEAKDFAVQFSKVVGAPRSSTTFVEAIRDILDNTVALLTQIGEKSDTVFADVESTLGMTFQKATYLRLISSATFADEFARRFLNYLYIVETAHMDPQGCALKDALTPAELEWVQANMANFLSVLAVLQLPTQEVTSQVEELPDAIVSEHSESALSGSLGSGKIDPFGFRNFLMPSVHVKWNPFYLVAQLLADFKITQHKRAKEELDLLQLRKLNLEKLYAKQPDARLQKQIEYLADRVSHLSFELQEMEKKYA